jgi:hypothetical protein
VAWGIQSGGVSSSIGFNRQFPTVAIFIVVIQQDDFAKTLLHPEVPKYYTWNTSRKVFCKRQQGARVTGYDDIRATDALGRNRCSYHGFLLYQVISLEFFHFILNPEQSRVFQLVCYIIFFWNILVLMFMLLFSAWPIIGTVWLLSST